MYQGTPLTLRPEALEAAETGKRVITKFERFGERYVWVFYPNGLQVMFELRKLPFVHINIGIRTGAFDDEIPGTAHALEHMLVKDPLIEGDHPVLQPLAPYGLEVNASTDYETVELYGKTAYRKWRELLKSLLTMMFQANTIDEKRWQKERPAIEQEIHSLKEEKLLDGALRELLHPHVPQLHPRSFGTLASVLSLSAERLRERYERDFHPDNAVIVFHGITDYERALTRLEEDVSLVTRSSTERRPPRAVLPYLAQHVNAELKFKGSSSVERVIGYAQLRNDGTSIPLETVHVLRVCLNDGGILRDELRRKRGWTYSQGCSVQTQRDDLIVLNISAQMRAEFHSAAKTAVRNLWRETCEQLGNQDPACTYALKRARGAHALRYMQRNLDRGELSVNFLVSTWLEQRLPKHRPFIEIPPDEFPAIARHAPKLADLDWHMISVVQDT